MGVKLFVDCSRGFSTDMFVGALLDMSGDHKRILQNLQDKIGKNMLLSADYAKSYDRGGIIFKSFAADFSNIHINSHSTLNDVFEFIEVSGFSDDIKTDAKAIYSELASAEAEVHGAEDVFKVHFHEVGQKRAVANILCACDIIKMLNVESLAFLPINTGYGKVSCAHGEVNVPAPATAVLLRSVPHFYDEKIKGELCGPTGAAFAKYYASEFIKKEDYQRREFKSLDHDRIFMGTGLGTKDIGVANGVIVTAYSDANYIYLKY